MRQLLLTLAFALPSLTWAAEPILPEATTEPLAHPLVTCTMTSTDLDMTEVAVDKDGNLEAKTNPKYITPEQNLAPYLIYRGLIVAVSTLEVRVQGSLLTAGGALELNLTLARGAGAPVATSVGGIPATCKVN